MTVSFLTSSAGKFQFLSGNQKISFLNGVRQIPLKFGTTLISACSSSNTGINLLNDNLNLPAFLAASCAIYNFPTYINNYGYPIIAVINGSIDDELLINGIIYETGKYPYFPVGYCGNTVSGNGSHTITPYTGIIQNEQNLSLSIFSYGGNIGGSLNVKLYSGNYKNYKIKTFSNIVIGNLIYNNDLTLAQNGFYIDFNNNWYEINNGVIINTGYC